MPVDAAPAAGHATPSQAQLRRVQDGLRQRLGSGTRAAQPFLDRVRRHLPVLRDELSGLYGSRADFESLIVEAQDLGAAMQMPALTGASLWVGKRYDENPDIRMLDHTYWEPAQGPGCGLDNVDTGLGEFSYALIRVGDFHLRRPQHRPRKRQGQRMVAGHTPGCPREVERRRRPRPAVAWRAAGATTTRSPTASPTSAAASPTPPRSKPGSDLP